MKTITLLDTTLRDGAQGEGMSFSMQDKLNLVAALDDFGVDYIEAGAPGSNPKDLEFFREAGKLHLVHAKLCAFGRTCHRNRLVAEDEGMQALLQAQTPVVTLVGKAHRAQAERILGVSREENRRMIAESIACLKREGREVVFDAEHFFDGVLLDGEYAWNVLETALQAGADAGCLCDTNGGTAPTMVLRIMEEAHRRFPQASLGIHAHNDCGCAVANSMLAVEGGATQVQGTFLGNGERCGNAALAVVVPNLLLKKDCVCGVKRLDKLCGTASRIAEIANVAIPGNTPYVGRSAFTHKGGMHADGQLKMNGAFEHVDPDAVGNRRRYLFSEMAGRSVFLDKVRAFAPGLTRDGAETARIVELLKRLEFSGYQFEAAEASFELLVRRELGLLHPHFKLVQYKTIGEFPVPTDAEPASAMIEVKVGGTTEISAALGNGPVHALDQALRKALKVFYPQVQRFHLVDYKVRVLDSESATAARVRVLIESRSGRSHWTTVGVSTDIIGASWLALADSVEYALRDEPALLE